VGTKQKALKIPRFSSDNMAKNRPTQRLSQGIQSGIVFSKKFYNSLEQVNEQSFDLENIVSESDAEESEEVMNEYIKIKNLPLKIRHHYCEFGLEGSVPSKEEWMKSVVPKIEPGQYAVLITLNSQGQILNSVIIKNKDGVPIEVERSLIPNSEFERRASSSPRHLATGKISSDTMIYETSRQQNGFPSVSQDNLQPIRDTPIPTRRDNFSNESHVERQVDTEIPTKKSQSPEPVAPRSQSGFSAEEIAAAEFGIPPEHELEPSNTSQLFRDDVSPKKSSDSTLMPVDDTQYSDDKTEKDVPVPSLSPSNTSVIFNNQSPVNDDLQLSDEDIELGEDDEAIVDLEGELGDTRFLNRTSTGKLAKPGSDEKFLDASAPPLSPSDTEMIPALPKEKSAQDYFGSRDQDDDDTARLRGLTTEINLPDVPNKISGILGKNDIPASKVLGKKDIPKEVPNEFIDANETAETIDFSDDMFSPPPTDDVGEDTELNMEPVKSEDYVPGSKTEHLPPIRKQEDYVLMDANEVPPDNSSPRLAPKLPPRVKAQRPAGVSVPKSAIEQAMEEHKKEEAKAHENKIAHVQKVIQAGKDAGLAFVYRDYPQTGEIGFLIPEEFAKKMSDTRFAAPKEFLDILDKAKINADDFALTQVYAAGGSTYDDALKFSPESIENQILSQWAHLYYLKVHNNSNVSDEQKRKFIEVTGIAAIVEGSKSAPLKKSLDKSEKKVETLQSEVDKYHALGSYNELVMLSGGKRPSKIKRYAAVAVLALAAGVGGYFLNNNKAPASNSDLEGKLAKVKTERDSANSKYEKLSKEYNTLVDSEKDLKQKVESLKNEKLAIEKKFESVVSKEDFDALSKEYDALKVEENKVKSQLDNVQKEKSDLEARLANEQKSSSEKDARLESQKSEYETQLSQKDALLKELAEKYSSYVPKESLDEIVKKNSEYEIQISQLTKELDSLKAEVKKYESLGKFEDVKALVDKQNKQQKVARNSDEVYKIFLGQLERHSVTDDELYRHIACANLTKAAIRSGEEAQVWLAFMRIVDQYSTKEFGSTKEQSSLVAAKLMEAVAVDGKFDDSSVDSVIAKYKNLRGQKSDEKWYDRKCLSAAELAEQHFMTK